MTAPRRKQLLQTAAVVACAVAAMATQPPRRVRNFPAWELGASEMRLREVALAAWVSKSGKTGMGVTLRVQNLLQRQQSVAIPRARLQVRDAATVSAAPQPARKLAAGATEHFYLPFAFDNERLWNDGKRRATVVLVLRIDGQKEIPWRLDASHLIRGGYHVYRRRPRSMPKVPAPPKAPAPPKVQQP